MSAQFSTTALPPGRYLARGTIRQGGKTHGHLTSPVPHRPRQTAAIGDAAVPASGGALPNEMSMRAARRVVEFRSEGTTVAGQR